MRERPQGSYESGSRPHRLELQSWAPSQEPWSSPQAFPVYPWDASTCWYQQQKTEVGSYQGARERQNASSPWGSRAGILPSKQTPLPHCLPCFREGQGGQREGEARSHKLRPHKQVRDNASCQAADPGSRRGRLGGGSTRLDISSTLEGRAVFSGSPDNRWGVGVGG